MEAGPLCGHYASLQQPISGRPFSSALILFQNSFLNHGRKTKRSSLLFSTRVRTLFSPTDLSTSAADSGNETAKNRVVVRRDDEFKSWLHNNGLPLSKVVLKRRYSTNKTRHKPMRYVAASENLQPGDIALSVPNSMIVTLERVIGDENLAELLTTSKLSELACLALYLMYEKKQGRESFWYPYIRELDRQRARGQSSVESPLLWSEEDLRHLDGSPTKAQVLERGEGIRREYEELDTVWFMAGSLFQQYPYDIPTGTFPFAIFKQAFVAVQSCVVHLQNVSLARRFALVPVGPPFLSYRSSCSAMLAAVDGSGTVELRVDRPYRSGECIVVWCGPQPNAKLLLNYGYVDEDNPYDRLAVEVSLNTKDPLYHEKRMALQRNGGLSRQTFHIHAGREKEGVLDVVGYLRRAYSREPESPGSGRVDRAALDQLKAYFDGRVRAYPTTLDEDERMLEEHDMDPKRRMAIRLVRLEKRMLHHCLAAVHDFIQFVGDEQPYLSSHLPLLK